MYLITCGQFRCNVRSLCQCTRPNSASGNRQKAVVTTNPIYQCEELEEVGSIYDDIEKHDDYDVLNENVIYIDVLPDETEECDQGSKPELPSPRPVT